MELIQTVLVGHHLSPSAPDGTADGGVFVCNDGGQAVDFKTLKAAGEHIEKYKLDTRVWRIFLLVEVPVV